MTNRKGETMDNAALPPEGTEDAWDTEALGADDAHVKVAPNRQKEIDEALDLHLISIRLQKGLLDNLKALAQLNGIGYQPLVRQVLHRFVECEMKNMLRGKLAEQAKEAESQEGGMPPEHRHAA